MTRIVHTTTEKYDFTRGRTLGYWFHDLYCLKETKCILKALERLRAPATRGLSQKHRSARREFWNSVISATGELYSAVETRINTKSTDLYALGSADLKNRLQGLDGACLEDNERGPALSSRDYLHGYWQMIGTTQSSRWRAKMKKLRQNPSKLRKFLKVDPPIRYALYDGMLLLNLHDQMPPRWLRYLEDNPEILRLVIVAALSDESLKEGRGRTDLRELTNFVVRLIDAAEQYSGNRITASDHNDRRSKIEGITRAVSPGIDFIFACVKPLYPPATLESTGGLIRRARKVQNQENLKDPDDS